MKWAEWDEQIKGMTVTPRELFNGNQSAYQFAEMIGAVANTWDDLIDNPNELTYEDINKCFFDLIFELQTNQFYRQYEGVLHPIMVSGMLSWFVANEYEYAKDETGIEIGHVLRYAIAQVMGHAIFICNGRARAMEHLPDFYKIVMADSIEKYKEEIL